ncbi:MAG: ribonuclease HII [Ruminococcaceae bacterium]|nr:ribonuclease HII [Oscillospiraceae bacterium]
MEQNLNLWTFESEVYGEETAAFGAGDFLICGVDEAGRGPLAGPVYAAAVILPFGEEIPGLNDSKKLTERQRDRLYDVIRQRAIAYAVASADQGEIDRINILAAAMLAMRRAVEALPVKPAMAFVDGNRDPKLGIPTRTIVKGDAKSASIAAASILAKVERDRFMLEAARDYPQYEFQRHKGYPTALHYELLAKYGPCPLHRFSFRLEAKK